MAIASPVVTVLLCVYNGLTFLAEAMDSVLGQSFGDFDCLVVDDGSTDGTSALLAKYAAADPRVMIVHNESNLGLTRSLNRGLRLVRSRYVARMDADDVCRPERLEQQVAFMDHHPNVVILGSWVEVFGDFVEQLWKPPIDDGRLRCEHLFHSSIYHPSAMFRMAFLRKHGVFYETAMTYSQDYELWVRVSRLGGRLANLPQPLLRFRMHSAKIGAKRLEEQDRSADEVRRRQLEELGILPRLEEFAVHRAVAMRQYVTRVTFLDAVGAWLTRLAIANRELGLFPGPDFEMLLAERWWEACSSAAGLGWTAFSRYCSQPILCVGGYFTTTRVRLLLKCLAHARG